MQELISGLIAIFVYFIVFAAGALTVRKCVNIPHEFFRKLLHFILLGSLLLWTLVFQTWWLAVVTAIGFAVIVYPILCLVERIEGFSELVTERKSGELKRSLLIVFLMYAIVTAICWGWLGDRLLSLCSIYAWGFGDAAAALVGKHYGKNHLSGRRIEGRKSLEGTLAMLCVSFVSVLTILLFRGGLSWYAYPVIALITATVSAVVELFSTGGNDTITCPIAAMIVILPLVSLFGGGLL